jgi:oligopeptide/dipeptide ABC transporter ATP-binding protein
MGAGMTLLEVADLRVDLQVEGVSRRVIHDVTLTVGPGEAVGLVGESGSGKSMTARSIVRLLPRGAQAAGTITFDGKPVLALSRSELLAFRASEVAMIFQDPRAHINPVRRVGDFLTEALTTCRRVPRREAERTVCRLMGETGISNPESRLRQYPHELSGGILQRVMIAAALAIEPRLLIADEPTTALDVTTQAEVMAIIDELRAERGLSMLFITHDLDLAAAVCDRTAVMYAGRIVEEQASARLHTEPLHPYTAALSASRPSITQSALRLPAIPGRPLAAFEVPDGCAFAPRCPFARDECRGLLPAVRAVGDGLVACHRTEQIRDHLATGALPAGHA